MKVEARLSMRTAILSVLLHGLAGFSPAVDLDQLWQQWKSNLTGPVRYLLTQEERDHLQAIAGDPEKVRRFAELFWARRTPEPGSRHNLFESDIRSRVLEADLRFHEPDLPGWETHRGILFIVLGEPDSSEKTLDNGIRVRSSRRPVIRWWYLHDRIDSCRDNPDYFVFSLVDDQRDGHYSLYPNLPTLFRCSKKRAYFPILDARRGYLNYRKNGIPPLLFEEANQTAIYHQEVALDLLPPALSADQTMEADSIDLPFAIRELHGPQPRRLEFTISYTDIPYLEVAGVQQATLEFHCQPPGADGSASLTREIQVRLTLDELDQKAGQQFEVALPLPENPAAEWQCWYLSKAGLTIRSQTQTLQLQPAG
jgi:GWxTD domain-containing protein